MRDIDVTFFAGIVVAISIFSLGWLFGVDSGGDKTCRKVLHALHATKQVDAIDVLVGYDVCQRE